MALRDVAAIFAGGVLGTSMRAGLGAMAAGSVWPWSTLTVNIVGAFALGVLLEALIAAGPDDGWRRSVRLTLGTGVLGSFTTYSALAWESWTLGAWGVAYAIGSVVAGALAAWSGVAVVRRWRR